MSKLTDFLTKHTIRGACTCGRCIDAQENPEKHQPCGDQVDLIFYKVAVTNSPDKEELRQLIKEHKGAFGEVDLFDRKEHSYIELGGWIGDQGQALLLMGLGAILELWTLTTPYTMFGEDYPASDAKTMAGNGFVIIQA